MPACPGLALGGVWWAPAGAVGQEEVETLARFPVPGCDLPVHIVFWRGEGSRTSPAGAPCTWCH